MPNVSEEISNMSTDLILKALGAFGPLGINAAKLVFDMGMDGTSTLIGLLNYLQNQPGAEYDAKTRKAIKQLRTACEQKNATALMATVEKEDLPTVKKWLDKQDLLYVAVSPQNKKKTPTQELAALVNKENLNKTTIFFMDEEKSKVSNTMSILAFQKGLINVLPPEAFFLLHDEKKDISVMDGLDFYELSIFRELAKRFQLGYTEMENGERQKEESVPGTYKVVCDKKDAGKLASIMRLVTWNMTGKDAAHIKEKVLERQTLRVELEKLLTEGVKSGSQVFIDDSANQVRVENAKYIVNAMEPNRYVKVTAKGFYCHKGSGDDTFVPIDDPDYDEKLLDSISGYPDFVILDAVEWEKGGLGKANLRKEKVLEKLSVLPVEHSLQEDEAEIRKAHKKRLERLEPVEEHVWLFYKYDPDSAVPLTEEAEELHSEVSKGSSNDTAAHYSTALKRAEKYRYYDVESAEKSVDNIISMARERASGNKDYGKEQKEAEF